jgi:hypothetical protein
MYDPMTVAHEIYLGSKQKKNGHYRTPLVTIWHVDPEKDGTDDSCGYSRVKLTQDEREYIKNVAKEQFRQLYARREALREEKSYAYICYNQDIYGAIYWLWRHFNKGKTIWQYGKHLSNEELQYVFQLATNPVDNFQSYKNNTLEEFETFVALLYRAYKTFKRPWHKHPRWHIHHWKIQITFLERIKRRYWDKCSVCGKRGFKGAAHGDWDGTKIWHQECDKSSQKAPQRILE